MAQPSHPRVYDAIGRGYARLRVPDPRIATRIEAALGGARRVCNVGAGTGSYEPAGAIAVEPSPEMIAQRVERSRVVRGVAEALPFADRAFDASLAILTLHHWLQPERGLAELCRIAPRRVVLGFDPGAVESFWLVREYLPEIARLDRDRTLPLERTAAALGAARIEPVLVPHDCRDGFLAAYWRRPERYLEPEVRAGISVLAQLPQPRVEAAMRRLAADLDSGAWHARHAELLTRDEADFGYRLLVSSAD